MRFSYEIHYYYETPITRYFINWASLNFWPGIMQIRFARAQLSLVSNMGLSVD